MATLFPPIYERRYAQYPRRFNVEYHVDGRSKFPDSRGKCATLASAKSHAIRAIELGYCHTVRIFDHMTGQYLLTYKNSVHGIMRHPDYVK
jgi:hypothetical protein